MTIEFKNLNQRAFELATELSDLMSELENRNPILVSGVSLYKSLGIGSGRVIIPFVPVFTPVEVDSTRIDFLTLSGKHGFSLLSFEPKLACEAMIFLYDITSRMGAVGFRISRDPVADIQRKYGCDLIPLNEDGALDIFKRILDSVRYSGNHPASPQRKS
ncbi:hypothetical protein A2125_00825 [Candidatus Woesebacteria bacterium GWB1_43_5]|uniref:Uncharacterized protein n=1 Tax=Candidatus Woesebacteria bacterium GWB1_43_5 TaxID=1802474 RepID=A0A1F7WS06_9BACT|nr:MAG: hypothetical protein A2125_00825 [Candidatus Woesebacteria bacterium GWB1_43_5]